MTVVLDTTFLLLFFRDGIGIPVDPTTKLPTTHARERISGLVDELENAGTKIIVPTPVLAELLVGAGELRAKIVEELSRPGIFRLAPFDTLAAIELAEMTRDAIEAGDKRAGATGSWAKVKFDRQIVAIANVARATIIYSDDEDLHKFATARGVKVVRLADLPIPPELAQLKLDLPTQ